MIENPNENLKCSSFLFDFVWVSIDKVWFDEDYLKKKKSLEFTLGLPDKEPM